MSDYTFPPPGDSRSYSNSNNSGINGSVHSFSFPNNSEISHKTDDNEKIDSQFNFQNITKYKIIQNNDSDGLNDNTGTPMSQQSVPTFNQIEIPDFDTINAPVKNKVFTNSPKSNDNVPYFQNNTNNNNNNNNNNTNDNTTTNNNIAGFSFPLKATSTNNSESSKNPSLSRIGSIRSIRNKSSAASIQDQQQQLKTISTANTANTKEVRKGLTTELKTPSEYTHHMIFTQFIRLAERKLEVPEASDNEVNEIFLSSLKVGTDPLFDKVIASLGYIAKKQPQRVVDSIMYWRKSKNESIESSVSAYNKNKHLLMLKQKQLKGTSHGSSSSSKMSLHSRNASSQSSMSLSRDNSNINNNNNHELNSNDSMSLQFLENQVEQARIIFVQVDNKANAASYLVCRVLIEVVKQISLTPNNLNFFNALEDSIYHQLKSMDQQVISQNKIKLANWVCLTELIGEISAKRFSRISDKFIADLEKTPGTVIKSNELYICLLIRGMKNLKLTNYPLEEFEESCGFLSSLTKFFYKSKNYMLMNVYCETLADLLLPLCGVLSAETDLPAWKEVTRLMLQKINTIIDKPKYWDFAFNLMCVCLTVCPSDTFYQNWFPLIEYHLNNKLFKNNNNKENAEYLVFSLSLEGKSIENYNQITSTRSTLIKSLSRLIWTYIFRYTESLNKTTKKLDSIFKSLFFQNIGSKKQQWITYDLELLQPIVILLRCIGYSNINYSMESLLLPLIKQSFNTFSLDNLSQERLIIVLKSYILILNDFISNTRPPYPTNEIFLKSFETPSSNFNTINIKEVLNTKNIDKNDILYHEEISNHFCKLFLMLDSEIGANTWSGKENSNNFAQPNYSSSSTNNPDSSPSLSSPSFLSSSKSPFHYFSSDSTQQMVKKQLNIDLFDYLIESIPWFYQLSNVIPYKKLVEILTRNSVHENSKIATVSIATLKKLCSKKSSGSLISTFAKFAFNFTEENSSSIKYSTSFLTSSSETYDKLLKIYYELLLSWLNFLKNSISPDNENSQIKDGNDFYILNGNFKMNMANTKPNKDSNDNDLNKNDALKDLEFNAIITTIEQVEGNGLFFLCSRSTSIRRLAVSILKVIPKFDDIIEEIYDKKKSVDSENKDFNEIELLRPSSTYISGNKTNSNDNRIIHILGTVPFFDLIGTLKLQLSMPEKKKLASLKSRNRKDLLLKLAEADYGVELTLWFKVFPKVLTIIFERNPITMALCRSTVCVRLIQLHEYISEFADIKTSSSLVTPGSSNRLLFGGTINNGMDTQPEVIVEQWKLFLVVACTSLTSTSNQELPPLKINDSTMAHQRMSSNTNTKSYSINSAKSVFKLVIPLLSTEQTLITDAVNAGLSCININIFKALVEVIQRIRINWETEIKAGSVNESNMRLRIEVTRILHATSKFLFEEQIYSDKRILTEMISFVKTVRSFLGASIVQESFEYQKLRRYFCGLLENVYIGVQKTNNSDQWFPFEARSGCFAFMEEWCGYGDSAEIAKKRYSIMKNHKNFKNNPAYSAAIEIETTALEYAAVSSMATLCSGAINHTVKGDKAFVIMAIDYKSLVSWIKALFETNNDILHKLGRKGLRNLLAFNKEKAIFDQSINEFYQSSFLNNKTAESYFFPICETLFGNLDYNCDFYEILVLGLYAVGLPNLEIRKMAGKLLVYIEKRYYGQNSVESMMDCICSNAKAIYKKAALNLSTIFANNYDKDKYYVISLFCLNLYKVGNDYQKDILTILYPWIKIINLKNQDYDIGYKFISNNDVYLEMIINNLLEITTKFGETYTNEVENLWLGLVDSNETNAITIVEYIFAICLHKRNSTLIESTKEIINYVYLSYPKIIDLLIKNINPKAMIPPDFKPIEPIKNSKKLPYIYSLPELKPRDMFSLGQISTIFLVDLLKMKPQNEIIRSNLSLLLNISFVLLDHYLTSVRVHAIELLCTVIHQLAYDNEKTKLTIENLRKHDIKFIWTYDDLDNDRNGARTPKNMDQLVRTVSEIFSLQFSSLQNEWSRTTLIWATTCSVRHIACRSFQAFRSLLTFLDKNMLRDMLHRLSNTISDPTPDIQGFAMQILMSLNAITAELTAEQLISFPELFWAAVACLKTVHEKEFIEVISIISKFISKIDLNSQDTISCLISIFPNNWEGKFEGLQTIVMIGLRSSTAWDASLKLLDRLNQLQSSELIAGPSRLLMALLANMPRFLHALETQEFTKEVKEAANILSNMALIEQQPGVSRIVLSLANNKFRKKEDFISQALSQIKENYFPEYQSQSLIFLLGLLMNKIKWVKLETLELLKYLFPFIDLTREEFHGVGADLLSPLLRLLLTDCSEKALEVLDETDNISGSQLDKDFIRLSLGNRTLRKEYEKIATLFGVPDESGWSIPMSAVTAAATRSNVHVVYLICRDSVTNINDDGKIQTEEEVVNFYDETPEKRSISNMYATLNYYESFFEANNNNDDSETYHDRQPSNGTNKTTTTTNTINTNNNDDSYKLDAYNSNNYSNYINYSSY